MLAMVTGGSSGSSIRQQLFPPSGSVYEGWEDKDGGTQEPTPASCLPRWRREPQDAEMRVERNVLECIREDEDYTQLESLSRSARQFPHFPHWAARGMAAQFQEAVFRSVSTQISSP